MTHPVRSPTHRAWASLGTCVHGLPSGEGTGPGAWGLQPAPSWRPRGHPLPSVLVRCPLDAPSRPQAAGLVCGPRGGPKIAVGLAWGWHARTCVTGRVRVGPVCAGPASQSPQILACWKKDREGGCSRGPPGDPRAMPTPCLVQVRARCPGRAAAAGRPPHLHSMGNRPSGYSGAT